MKRFPVFRAFEMIFLLGVLVILSPVHLAFAATHVTTSTSSTSRKYSGPGDQVFTCLGSIAITVAATLLDEEELSFGKLSGSASTCISAALAIFDPPANSTPPSPQIDVHASLYDGSISGSVRSSLVGNCTDFPKTLQFNFDVPFQMIVGPQFSQEEFNTSPSGSSDDELVAQQLFNQYGGYIAGKTTGGPSQSAVYTISPHTQVSFILPIIQYYKSGEARVVHSDGSTVTLPWFFTDGYQQNGQITYTESYC